MAKLIIDGLTKEQAQTLANWYEGQGEQQADFWFEVNGVETPYAHVSRKGGCMEQDGDDTILYCHTP